MNNRNAQILGLHLQTWGNNFIDHIDRAIRKCLCRGVAAENVLVAALGDGVRNGTEFEIGHPSQLTDLRGGKRDRRSVTAEDGLDVFNRGKLSGGTDSLRGIHRISLKNCNFLALQATFGVALFDRQFKAAIAFITQQGQATAERVQRPQPDVLCVDGTGRTDQGQHQRAECFLEFHIDSNKIDGWDDSLLCCSVVLPV